MAIEHKDIPEANRHEPKGATFANPGEVLVASTGDATLFRNLVQSDIIDLPSPIPSEFVVTDFLMASDYTDQVSSIAGNVQGITFGAADVSVGGSISLDVNGEFTINSAGTYLIKVVLALGRSSGAGASQLFIRGIIDGVPTDSTRSVTMNDSGVSSVCMITETFLGPQVEDTHFCFEQLLDSNGGGDTGLMVASPVSQPWADSPSAYAVVYRLGIA